MNTTACQRHERRQQAQQTGMGCYPLTRPLSSRETHNERHADRPLIEAALLYHAFLGEHVTVVAHNHDYGVVGESLALELIEQLSALATM